MEWIAVKFGKVVEGISRPKKKGTKKKGTFVRNVPRDFGILF
jgi:hypothetical protein